MTFYVGQKVVCVEDRPGLYTPPGRRFDPYMGGLVSGAVYTIRAVGQCDIWLQPAVWLDEIYRGTFDRSDPGFSPERFRPLVERKTDISIFKAMLTPEQVPA